MFSEGSSMAQKFSIENSTEDDAIGL